MINLPGRLMKTWTMGSQRFFLTYDYNYSPVWQNTNQKYPSWQHSFRLNLLREVKPMGVPALR